MKHYFQKFVNAFFAFIGVFAIIIAGTYTSQQMLQVDNISMLANAYELLIVIDAVFFFFLFVMQRRKSVNKASILIVKLVSAIIVTAGVFALCFSPIAVATFILTLLSLVGVFVLFKVVKNWQKLKLEACNSLTNLDIQSKHITELKNKLNAIKAANADLSKQLDEEQRSHAGCKANLQAVQDKCTELNDRYTALQEEYAKLDEHCNDLLNSRDKYKGELELLNAAFEAFKKRSAAAKKAAARRKAKSAKEDKA